MNGWNKRVSGFLISPNIWSRDYPKEAFFSSALRQKTSSPKIFDEWKTMTSTESLFQMARLPRGCICTLIKNLNPVICCWGSSRGECRKKVYNVRTSRKVRKVSLLFLFKSTLQPIFTSLSWQKCNFTAWYAIFTKTTEKFTSFFLCSSLKRPRLAMQIK